MSITVDKILKQILMHRHKADDLTEADPIFVASEAALLVVGDKAKIDTVLNPSTYVTTNTVQNIVAQKTMQADFRIKQGKKLIFES